MEKSNRNLYVTYQLFFNKFLEESGYRFEILNSDDDCLDYMVLLTDPDDPSRSSVNKVLLSIDVENREFNIFSVIESKLKRYSKKINELNMRLPYGKIYIFKNKISYYLKVKLPNNIEEFSLETFEEYVIEIRYSVLYINKKDVGIE